jgi:hypothetical protein
MKQLLSLFLFLVPCLAWAQYPSNGNQKITLGEQTTADGLVYRGLAADTTRKPSVDTMAFILLDTNTNIIWQYKKATNNAWTRVGGSISSGVTGVLPVANGGTNRITMPAGYVLHGDDTSVDTAIGLFWDRTNSELGIGTNNPGYKLHVNSSVAADWVTVIANQNSSNGFGLFVQAADNASSSILGLYSGSGYKFYVNGNGEVWLGYSVDGNRGTFPLQVNGQIYATNATIATSDEKFKENITPLNKGLEIVNKLKPVTFNFISDTENNFSEYEEVGFIAQDVDRALSTETFSKSIVKAADDSEPTSTMGLATQNLIPILVKAIQEQQALIKALEQRILILENK